MQIPSQPFIAPKRPSWREQAARIVEELFPATSPSAWNCLLDLRQRLLHEEDGEAILDGFLACRERLEADHYLPFYRLRRLLAASLKLEFGQDIPSLAIRPLHELLRNGHRSVADFRRAVRRDAFEHMLDLPAHEDAPFRLVECEIP